MFHTYLLISILLPLTSAILFDVKRYAADPKDGNEPYRPINYFLNKQRKRSICLFMFCWHHYGNCKSNIDCCECKCKNSATYFSDPLGCKEGHDMTNMTKEVGKECYFATKKFGFDYVPLFDNQSRFIDIQLDLPRSNFRLNDGKTICKVGAIHDYDYHGHKLLFDRNLCSELFQVHQKQGKQYLQFHSTNVSIWNSFRGRLLSVDIDCHTPQLSRVFSSCFLFQVEGKYKEEVDGEEPPEIPAGYACPTAKNDKINKPPQTITETTTLESTTTSTTNLGITSIHSSRTTIVGTTTTLRSPPSSLLHHITWEHITPHTTMQPAIIHPTTLPPITFQHVTKQPKVLKTTKMIKVQGRSPKSTRVTVIFLDAEDTVTGTTISILTGLGTGLAVIMICVIIWMLIKKRKEIFKSQSVNTPIFNPEDHQYDHHDSQFTIRDHSHDYHYDVPNGNVKPFVVIPECGLPNGRSSYNFAPFDDDLSSCGYSRQYSYIGAKDDVDEQDFESRENTILLKSRGGSKKSGDMSKRPLPEKPMESGNPYYSVALISGKSDKTSEANDMYSLYSTIDDLKGL